MRLFQLYISPARVAELEIMKLFDEFGIEAQLSLHTISPYINYYLHIKIIPVEIQ